MSDFGLNGPQDPSGAYFEFLEICDGWANSGPLAEASPAGAYLIW